MKKSNNPSYNPTLRHQKELVVTHDNTKTLYSHEFKEHYHSTHDGALTESLYKHIVPALRLNAHKKHLRILDICFGLGYNTFATLYYIDKHQLDVSVEIVSPEFDLELIQSLQHFTYPKEFDNLKNIILSLSNTLKYQNEKISITILLGDARLSIPKLTQKFDIVYQDAFSPKTNPLLWTREYFADIAKLMAHDGILTTYSSAIAVRLALFENGFNLYLHQDKRIRNATIASFNALEGIQKIDMEHKIATNPNAKSLSDKDFL
ncbi:MAG: hypothetical protein JXQ76_03410 [Campylobacterales bacterium]|nr:hypothetical protein [Campylobacterales bacterium]